MADTYNKCFSHFFILEPYFELKCFVHIGTVSDEMGKPEEALETYNKSPQHPGHSPHSRQHWGHGL